MKQLNNNINEFDSFLKQHGVKLENHKSNDTTILQSNLNTYINRTHSVVSELHKKTQKDLKEILPAVSITLFLIILLFYPFTVRFFCYFVGKQGGLSFGLPLGF